MNNKEKKQIKTNCSTKEMSNSFESDMKPYKMVSLNITQRELKQFRAASRLRFLYNK